MSLRLVSAPRFGINVLVKGLSAEETNAIWEKGSPTSPNDRTLVVVNKPAKETLIISSQSFDSGNTLYRDLFNIFDHWKNGKLISSETFNTLFYSLFDVFRNPPYPTDLVTVYASPNQNSDKEH